MHAHRPDPSLSWYDTLSELILFIGGIQLNLEIRAYGLLIMREL